MPLYKFLHNLLNLLVQIANKMGLRNSSLDASIASSTEMSVPTRATRRNFPENGVIEIILALILQGLIVVAPV
jgi:hypothetical protein